MLHTARRGKLTRCQHDMVTVKNNIEFWNFRIHDDTLDKLYPCMCPSRSSKIVHLQASHNANRHNTAVAFLIAVMSKGIVQSAGLSHDSTAAAGLFQVFIQS